MTPETKNIPLDAIDIDAGTQSRAQPSSETIDEYVEALKAGELPPADIYVDEDGVGYMGDGFHRYAAYKISGRKSMPCTVREGTYQDAVQHSCGANETHGLRRTAEDRRSALRLAWETWPGKSVNAIAEICKVSAGLASDVRAEMQEAGDIEPVESVTGKDGRQYSPREIEEDVLIGEAAVEAACHISSPYVRVSEPVGANHLKKGAEIEEGATWHDILDGQSVPVVDAMIGTEASVPIGYEEDRGNVIRLVRRELAVAARPDILRAKPLSAEHAEREAAKVEQERGKELARDAMTTLLDHCWAKPKPADKLPKVIARLALAQAHPSATDFAKEFFEVQGAADLLELLEQGDNRTALDITLAAFVGGELRNVRDLEECHIYQKALEILS